MLSLSSLAMAGSPIAWAFLLLIAMVVISPRLLPPLARFLAALAGMHIRRKLGIPDPPRPRRTGKPGTEVEVLPPSTSQPTLRAGAKSSLVDLRPVPRVDASPRSTRPIWRASVIVSVAVAVLLWYLLHTR